MLLRIINTTILFFVLTAYSYSAATSSGSKKSNYDQAYKLIKVAKKYELKGKDKKAKKRYERALKLLVKAIDQKKKEKLRDKALILIGFAGGFRRSELVSITKEDSEFVAEGVKILIRRSKNLDV